MSGTEENKAPALPDYFTDPDAVLKDEAAWRFGRRPDYTKNRQAFNETKTMNHKADSLEQLVENVVKNWEIEASYKKDPKEWRVIDPETYTFRLNGGPPQPAEAMSKIGTYNALIEPNKYYSPEHNDFSASHKTFKRMMPFFAWEVLDVYGGPPKLAIRWRHWGTFHNDYSAVNDKGEKIVIKATGKTIDLRGMTVVELDDKMRVTSLDIYFDPMDMFRQMDGTSDGPAPLAAAAGACPFLGAQVPDGEEKAPES